MAKKGNSFQIVSSPLQHEIKLIVEVNENGFFKSVQTFKVQFRFYPDFYRVLDDYHCEVIETDAERKFDDTMMKPLNLIIRTELFQYFSQSKPIDKTYRLLCNLRWRPLKRTLLRFNPRDMERELAFITHMDTCMQLQSMHLRPCVELFDSMECLGEEFKAILHCAGLHTIGDLFRTNMEVTLKKLFPTEMAGKLLQNLALSYPQLYQDELRRKLKS